MIAGVVSVAQTFAGVAWMRTDSRTIRVLFKAVFMMAQDTHNFPSGIEEMRQAVTLGFI
jgi:hypothetical protein